MDGLRVTLHGAITDMDAYRSVGEKMRAAVADTEPDTTAYEWWVSEDGASFVNVDEYRSSDAFLSHFGAAQERGDLDAFMGSVDIKLVEVVGAPSPEARGVLEQFGAVFLESAGAVTR